MQTFIKLTHRPRGQIALVVALAGCVVSLVMVHWGGQLSRHLPDQGFHIAAFIGAGLAGWIVADGLGHAGRKGWFLSGASFLGATVIGAPLGSTIGMAVILPPFQGLTGPGVAQFISAVPTLVGFGWLAVLDGLLTSLPVAAVWGAAVVLVHIPARSIRRRHAVMQSAALF